MEENIGTDDSKPAVTTEEFAELRNMQAQQTLLQSQGYQLFNFLKQMDGQYEEITRNYHAQKSQAQEQLDKVETELQTANNTFQMRFKDIIAQYGFDGATAVNISETEPHYLTKVEVAEVAEQPADYIESEA